MDRRRSRSAALGYALLAPSLFGVAAFLLLPILVVVWLSLHRWDLLGPITFVGGENWRSVLTDSAFGNSLLTTVLFVAIVVPTQTALGLAVAALLARELPGTGVFRTLYVLPWICAPLAIAVLWSWILAPTDGAVATVLGHHVEWLTDPGLALPVVSAVVVWTNVGYVALFFVAGILAIPAEVHAAARADGANAWQRFWRITLPMLRPTMFFVLVTGVVSAAQVFDTVYALTGGGRPAAPIWSHTASTTRRSARRRSDGPRSWRWCCLFCWSGSPSSSTCTFDDGSAMSSRNVAVYTGLMLGALITVAPFALGLLTSFTSAHQFATGTPLAWPRPPVLANYTGLAGAGFGRALAVTALMTAVIVVGQLTFSVLAGYAFARLRFPGRDTLFWVYVATLMVPATVTVVPLYLMMAQLGLRNTFWALVLPFLFGSPYAIFLLRQYFRSIPGDLINAAHLDGANTLDVIVHVVVPASRPILVTLTLITVVSQWNNFMWPLVITSGPKWQVLTVATAGLQSQYNAQWTLVMAASTVAMVPLMVLFVVFQRQIVRSLVVTGLK